MVSEWKEMELGEVCDLRAGSAFKPKFQGKLFGDYPFVKVSDMNHPANSVRIQIANNWVSEADIKELRANPFPSGTVVFAKIGEALRQNRLRQIGRETIIDNNMMGAIPRQNKIDSNFFYYALSKFDFSSIAQGTALPYLTITDLSALKLYLPSISEQRAIASVLRAIDDRIEYNRLLACKLEAIARRIFKSWFIDFDPVHAMAAGEKPLGIADDILALFPARFVDSELGELPEGWNVGKISDFSANVRAGCTPSQFTAEDFYVGLEHFDRRCLTLWDGGNGDDATSNKSRFAKGDLLFGKLRPYFHKVAVAPMDGICSTDILVIRCIEKAYREFMYFSLFQDNVIQYVSDASGGTRMPRTNWETLSGYDCVLPPKALASVFGEIVAPMIETMIQCVVENSSLTELRDLLLPRLISGKLRVEDAENIIEDAVA